MSNVSPPLYTIMGIEEEEEIKKQELPRGHVEVLISAWQATEQSGRRRNTDWNLMTKQREKPDEFSVSERSPMSRFSECAARRL